MSYILEALRRAEGERARGRVPGLEAQALTLAADDEVSRPRAAVPWIGAALLLGALAAAAGWWWLGRQAGPAERADALHRGATPGVATGPVTVGQSPPAALPGAPAPMPVAPAVTPPPVTMAPSTGSAAPDLPKAAPSATRSAAPGAAVLPAPAPSPPSPSLPTAKPGQPLARAPSTGADAMTQPLPNMAAGERAPGDAPPRPIVGESSGAARRPAAVTSSPALAGSSSSEARPAAPPRALPLSELTAQQRSELPPLAIGGAIYSDSAASRFILINGQVVREGESAAPGVILERITPKSAVLRWRELRIEVPL